MQTLCFQIGGWLLRCGIVSVDTLFIPVQENVNSTMHLLLEGRSNVLHRNIFSPIIYRPNNYRYVENI